MKIFNKFKKNKEKTNKKSKKCSVFLHICGYNLERWLNFLTSKGTKFFSVEKQDVKNSVVEGSLFDEKKIEKFFKSKNISVQKKEYGLLAKPIVFLKKRWGILVGLFVFVCFFAVATNFVWKIEITGNERCSTQEIEKVLEENGIGFFSSINSKSNEEIEKIISNNFDVISLVSVVKKGTSIIVNIKEKLFNEEYESLEKGEFLIAKQDGIITEINLIQGTLLVKVGDFVRAGDRLVAPFAVDSSGKQIPIQPKAEIFADVWLSGETIVETKKQVEERTGKFLTERKIVFLNQEILTKKEEILFEQYDLEIFEENLSEILPIKYKTVVYHEVETKIVETNFEDVKEEKIALAKELALSMLAEGETIKAENSLITEENGRFVVSHSITVSRKIS